MATFAVFAGHGWEHLWNGGPYRAIFLNDAIFQGLAQKLGYHWIDILQNPAVDGIIMQIGRGIGIFFLIASMLIIIAPQLPKWVNRLVLIGGAGLLFFYTCSLYFEKGQYLGLLLEYSAQYTSPLLLYSTIYWSLRTPKMILILKIVIGITFICHGLFALGYYPRPGHFVDMVIYGFGVTESVAHRLLFAVGILDILMVWLMFLPYRGAIYTGLIYAFIWGFLTSLARIVTTFEMEWVSASVLQNFPGFLFRFPHFLLPLIIIILTYQWENRHKKIGL